MIAEETAVLITTIFDGPDGREALSRIDETMSRLPGLRGFDLMTRRMEAAWTRSPTL